MCDDSWTLLPCLIQWLSNGARTESERLIAYEFYLRVFPRYCSVQR